MTMLNKNSFNKKWAILALLWFALLLYALLLKPTGNLPKVANADKIAHFGIFFGQFWLMGRSLVNYPNKIYWTIGILFALFLAVGTEILQGMTGYRSQEFWDGVADMVGAGVALGLVKWADKCGYLKENLQ